MDASNFRLLLFLWLIEAVFGVVLGEGFKNLLSTGKWVDEPVEVTRVFGQLLENDCNQLADKIYQLGEVPKESELKVKECRAGFPYIKFPNWITEETTEESMGSSTFDCKELIETKPSEELTSMEIITESSNFNNEEGNTMEPTGGETSQDSATEKSVDSSEKEETVEPNTAKEAEKQSTTTTKANQGSGDQTANTPNNEGNAGLTENSAGDQKSAVTEANLGVNDGKTNAPDNQNEPVVTKNGLEDADNNANKENEDPKTNAPGDLENQGVTQNSAAGQERVGTEEASDGSGMGEHPTEKSQNGSKKKKTGKEKDGTRSKFPLWVPMAIGFGGCVLSCIIYATVSTFVCSKGKERPMYMA